MITINKDVFMLRDVSVVYDLHTTGGNQQCCNTVSNITLLVFFMHEIGCDIVFSQYNITFSYISLYADNELLSLCIDTLNDMQYSSSYDSFYVTKLLDVFRKYNWPLTI